jgi:hypothetical protein
MSTPHKATESQWGIVRRWINDDAVASVLLEVADRVAALEAAFASRGEQISGLHSQHNLVVDSITDLQGCVNQLEAAATPPPAPAGGLVEMVAEEIYDFTGDHVDDNEASAVIRAVADWLQQRSSTIANGSQWAEMLRKETDRSSAAPPRPVPPPPAPAGGLLEDVTRLLTNRISLMLPDADCKYLARDALVVVADWLDARGDRGSAAALRREADR